MIHDYTVDDLIIILYDRYSLSDLEFALGVGLADFEGGIYSFVAEFYDDIVAMIKEDEEVPRWDN